MSEPTTVESLYGEIGQTPPKFRMIDGEEWEEFKLLPGTAIKIGDEVEDAAGSTVLRRRSRS